MFGEEGGCPGERMVVVLVLVTAVADAVGQLRHQEGIASLSDVMAKDRPIDAHTLSTLMIEMSDGLVDIPMCGH